MAVPSITEITVATPKSSSVKGVRFLMQAPMNAANKITVHPAESVRSVCVGYPVQVGVTVRGFVVIKFPLLFG